MYKLVWIVNNVIIETVLNNVPKAIAYWKKLKISSNYTFGQLKVIKQ